MQVNFDTLEGAPTSIDPFPHCVVPNFLPRESVSQIIADFPALDMAGLFIPEDLRYGPNFQALLELVDGPQLRKAVGEKLGLDLTGLKTLVTIRGCCQGKDGRIHADAKFKVATVLIYLNEPWENEGGRLRILRSGTDIEDYAGEVPPNGGTLVCFRVQPNSWHGHKPFVGPRRYLMINYCKNESLRDKEWQRHRFSGRLKRLKRLFGIGKIPVAA
jgi:hypothetical protein